jgi:transcription elongation factor Elf1
MTHSFYCPDCGHEHSEPAIADFVLTVQCLDCELAAAVAAHEAERDAVQPIPEAA